MRHRKDRLGRAKLGQPLYRDEIERVQLEARNGLLLFDGVMKLVDESGSDLDLTPKTVENLHRLAIRGIYSCAGKFRKWPVTIKESLHKPPEEKYVEGLVKEMCDQANTNTEWPEDRSLSTMAAELDSPLRRGEWPYFQGTLISGVMYSTRLQAARQVHDPRTDCERQGSIPSGT
jgi:hypothetical protein